MTDLDDAPAVDSEVHRFPCDRCGSGMRFDPGDDRLICDHCGNVEPLGSDAETRTEALRELDFRSAVEGRVADAETDVVATSNCPNCGARIDFDPDIRATECPYCATPVVARSQSRRIRPRAILPFVLEETEARAAMTRWLGSLWFAPNGLTRYARRGRRMSGVYTPCWTFDARTTSDYAGQRGTDYHERRRVMRNGKPATVTVTRTRWRRVTGRVARAFDDVLVLASTALPERFRRQAMHWDLSRLEPWQPHYLAGFSAEAYSVDLEAAFVEAREKMDAQIARDVRFDIGGDRQRIERIDTRIEDVTFKHILVPLWLAAYRFRGESYRFVVNGQTGEVAGERPWSRWKIALAVIAGTIAAAAAGYLYATYGRGLN